MDFGPYTPYIVLAIVGLVAGWLCGLLLGGGGLIRNLIVGVIGAFVGGYLFYNILNIRITGKSLGRSDRHRDHRRCRRDAAGEGHSALTEVDF